jgi:transposase
MTATRAYPRMGVPNIKNLFQGDLAMKIVAMDLGKNKTMVCYYDSVNGSHRFLTVRTQPQAIHDALVAQPADRVVMEIGSAAGWIYDMATSLHFTTQVANTNHEAWRWKNVKKKADRDDALRLARLSAAEQLPQVHMPRQEVRQKRATITYRQNLVARRTAIKNDIRAILDREGLTMAAGKSGWTHESLVYLQSLARPIDQCNGTELWRGQLAVELQLYEAIEAAIKQVQDKLDELGKSDERVQLLQTIPGVGPRLAEAVAAYIDDPNRFKSGKQVGSYFGITPRQFQSGSMDRSGGISGMGNKLVRTLLVEVSWLGLRHNPWLRALYERIMRGTKSRKKIAIVAAARRLLVVCWAMLRDNRRWKMPELVNQKAAA